MSEDSLGILLIEDNPGDARFVRELIESIGPIGRQFDSIMRPVTESDDVPAGAHNGRGPTEVEVRHVERLSAALDELDRGRIDVALLDLNLPDSRGLDTLDAVAEHAPTVPIVVLTGMQDHGLGLEALDHGAQEYLVKDEVSADLLIRTVFHAIQRERYERALERQHERLSTLYESSKVVQDIGGSLIDYSTIEEIESTVCDRLAGSEMYSSAWIGEVDQNTGSVVPRADAVAEGFFDGWTVSIDGRDGSGPIATAALTEEVQVVRDAEEEPGYGDWREHARAFGYRSLAAIPIAYEDALYGILVVYSERSNAFETEERGIMTRLGNVVGHAINAVERKTALMSDDAIELELLFPDLVGGVSEESRGSDNRIEFLTTIPAGDGSYLQYANVEGFSRESLMDLLEQLPQFHDVREIRETADRRLIEIRYTGPPIVSTLATYGGRIRSASLADGDYRVVIGLPSDADVRSFVESVRESYGGVNLIAQRSVESRSSSELSGTVRRDGVLTDKQRGALEAAYFSGYFDQPRTRTGEDIADSLGITASTFHQHLRAGLRKLLAAEFEGESRIDGHQS